MLCCFNYILNLQLLSQIPGEEAKRTEIKNSVLFLNISKHTWYYVEFFRNSILASAIAVFECDVICFLEKVISEANGPMQLDPDFILTSRCLDEI